MDQPTYTPTQKIVEASRTLFFKFGDLDSTKPAGSIKIRVETVVHYMAKYSQEIMRSKLARLSPNCPLGPLPQSAQSMTHAEVPTSNPIATDTAAVSVVAQP
jgi:hypothetical protein